ncbi:MAG: hypothetical protein UT43_C0006G0016 [Parcubacteria group bacterium GW2011_GWC1_39_29]|nr:MAG: hypothetical protein UT43_C0006G0016 [Parcubacteria group bacterium GW2011_GWC1_39_29]
MKEIMIRKILINFLIILFVLLLTIGLGVLLYHYYFADTSVVFDVVLTFFAIIIYSNILSKIYLFFWKVNFA